MSDRNSIRQSMERWLGMTMKLSKAELETVIGCSAADSEWDIVTADPRFIRYLKKRGWTLEPDRQFPTHLACRLPFAKLRVLRPENRKGRLTVAFRKIASPNPLVSGAGEVRTGILNQKRESL
jgi:hypothetical protein